MTKQICCAVLVSGIILMLLVAGCVTPPKGTTTSSASGNYYATETNAQETPTSPSYVNAATPFVTSTSGVQAASGSGSNPYATPTPISADLSCLIYQNTQFFSSNTTAISFDLKNPPMYITYSVVPFNITVDKYVNSKQSAGWVTLQYSDYAPYSWFEITVRDNETGNVYLDNGFGPYRAANPLSIYTNATLGPILNSGDLHIEMTGNDITATTGIWVKPVGNIDDPQNQTFPECQYWGVHPQNYLEYSTTTATPTWTPVNVQTPNGY